NNQYFVLQCARGTTVAESGTRATLYVMALSSTLVATGFVAQSPLALGPFLAVVLPTLFVLGLFTIVRLVDTGVENLSCIRSMTRIRHYYAELAREAPEFFGDRSEAGASALAPMAIVAVRRGKRVGLFTIASMIAVVNAVVGGTGITLLVSHLRGGFVQGYLLPIAAGLVAGLALVAAFLIYQDRRYALVPSTGSSPQ
ncbi:MAG: hypothetical protein ACTHMJ_00970, partial [Thermomicrobiales bacterium]